MSSWSKNFKQLRELVGKLPLFRILALLAVSCYGLAAFLDPRPDGGLSEQPIQEVLNIDGQIVADKNLPPQPAIHISWSEQSVSSGDNLSTLFQRAGLSALDVHKISSSKQGNSLLNLYPGELLRFGIDAEGNLQEMHYQKSPLESYIFTANNGGYQSRWQLRNPEVLTAYREGIIEESLYLAGKEANLPDKIVMELANIFGWDIDFVFDIRAGDSFALLFEERYIDGRQLSAGNILAASFTNRGKTYSAVRFKDSRGRSSYYSPEGLSMRKAFLRTPLDIFRISSGFNLRRKHPIHKKIKAHRGVDYAAPRGTPVYAAGDGKVIEAGYSKANGNYVVIQHGQTYTTKYLHLNRKKVRRGHIVRQRQMIGSVGSTGYATGPHLHYEFLVNGVHRNPRTVALPQAKPIPQSEKTAFSNRATALLTQLADHQQSSQLALRNGAPQNAN